MEQVRIKFIGSLNKLLSKDRRNSWIKSDLHDSRSIKDIIESYNIPHTEAGKVLVNGEPATITQKILPGDQVEVYPAFIDVEKPIQDILPPPMPKKFILDVHLGTLAKYLRGMGVDVHYDDDKIVEISLKEDRTILTRNRGILKRACVKNGYLIKSQNTMIQLKEVLINFSPPLEIFSRCTLCNGKLEEVPMEDIIGELEPLTVKHYREFYRCTSCKKIYWKGGHFERMSERIDKLLDEIEVYEQFCSN